MKRTVLMVSALALCVTVGVTALAFGAQAKRDTSATLAYFEGPDQTAPYDEVAAAFAGDVKSKGRCKRRREVRIGPALGIVVRTNKQGEFVALLDDPVKPGSYRAVVQKRFILKANGEKVICRRGQSSRITVP